MVMIPPGAQNRLHHLGSVLFAQNPDFSRACELAREFLGFIPPVTGFVSSQLRENAEKLLGSADPSLQNEGAQLVHALGQTLVGMHGLDTYSPTPTNGVPRALDVVLQGYAKLANVSQDTVHSWGARLFKGLPIWRGPLRWLRHPLKSVQDLVFTEMLADENLKKRVIAFLDAATALIGSHPQQLPGLLHQYFPREMRSGGLLGLSFRASWIFPESLIQWGIKKSVYMMGSRFLAGSTAEEAVATAARLEKKGLMMSLDVVTEGVRSRAEVKRYVENVIHLIELEGARDTKAEVTEGGVPVRHVSIKLSALTHRFDPVDHDRVVEEVAQELLKFFKAAQAQAKKGRRVLVNVDLEEFAVRDLSYQIFWKALSHADLKGWEDAGVVVQAYHKDSTSVLMQNMNLAHQLNKKIQIRLVKGAYHWFELILATVKGWVAPVFLRQRDTDDNFIRLCRIALLNHDSIRVAVGTHNLRDVEIVQALREIFGVSIHELEHQFLYGVGDDPAIATAKLGIPTRMYGPFGNELDAIGYEVRRFDEVRKESAIGEMHVSASAEGYRRERDDISEKRVATLPPIDLRFTSEPEVDFSKGVVRKAMRDAVATRKALGRVDVGPLVAGPALDVSTAESVERRNPADLSDLVGHVRYATPEEVDQAIAQAQDGFKEWSGLTPTHRRNILLLAAQKVREKRHEIAAMIEAEVGKPRQQAMGEINEAIDYLASYAQHGFELSETHHPLGVGAAISPFNFAFGIAMGQVVGGLALGNSMILKPSEQTSRVGQYVVDILREAGVPERAIQFLPGRGELVGQRLVESDGIDFVAMTGSKNAADKIAATAVKHPSKRCGLKKVVAETGSKNPLIVDSTADLDMAVEAILNGAFVMNGQRCSSTSRVIVTDDIADRLIERLREGARDMVVGNPSDEGVQLGPQVDEKSLEKVRDYLQMAQEDASVRRIYPEQVEPALPGQRNGAGSVGYYVGPHIFEVTDPQHRLFQEEIFGPVLSIMRVHSFDEAIRVANDTPYALTAALFSRDLMHIETFKSEINAGNVYINRAQVAAQPERQPFGGFYDSGSGPKAGEKDYVAACGRPAQAHTVGRVFPEARSWNFTERRQDENDGSFVTHLQTSQKKWARQEAQRLERLKLLERVLQVKVSSANTLDRQAELQQALGLVSKIVEQAPALLTLQETLRVPGEINERVFDRPLGVGLIWSQEGQSLFETISAVASALVMGNTVILPDNKLNKEVWNIFKEALYLSDHIFLTRIPLQKLTQKPWLNFVVAHGSTAAEIHQGMKPVNNPGEGLKRFIGGEYDHPEIIPSYLKRFAHERVITENTLRHGADLNLRLVQA